MAGAPACGLYSAVHYITGKIMGPNEPSNKISCASMVRKTSRQTYRTPWAREVSQQPHSCPGTLHPPWALPSRLLPLHQSKLPDPRFNSNAPQGQMGPN